MIIKRKPADRQLKRLKSTFHGAHRYLPCLLSVLLLTAILVVSGFTLRDPIPLPQTVADNSKLPFVQINNYPFHAETFGRRDNPLLVVLHGGPGGDFRYLRHLASLSNRYFVLLYDRRGTGLSPRVPEDHLTLSQSMNDLHNMISHFNSGGDVHLIGHQFGATLAALYTARYPDQVAGLVLADLPFIGGETPEPANSRQWHGDIEAVPLHRRLWVWLQSSRVPLIDGHERRDFHRDRLRRIDRPNHPQSGLYCSRTVTADRTPYWRHGALAADSLLKIAETEWQQEKDNQISSLGDWSGEVLFLSGACNTLSGATLQRRHMDLFQFPALVIIPNVGTTLFTDQPERTVAAIRNHLRRVNSVHQ